MLTCDRFYGAQALIGLCKEFRRSYRIRLKDNFLFQHERTEISLKDAVTLGLSSEENVILGSVHKHILPFFMKISIHNL